MGQEAFRHERNVVAGLDGGNGDDDEGAERDQLDGDQDDIDCGAFTRADDQHGGDQEDNANRQYVDDAAFHGSGQEVGRNVHAPRDEKTVHVRRPARRHRGRTQGVFKDKRPADRPGYAFAKHRIGIGVGAAGRGDQGGDFGIGQRGQGADNARHGEGEDDARSGQVCADAGQGEDTHADDGADTHGDQVRPAQGLGQGPFGVRVIVERFDAPEAHLVSPVAVAVETGRHSALTYRRLSIRLALRWRHG